MWPYCGEIEIDLPCIISALVWFPGIQITFECLHVCELIGDERRHVGYNFTLMRSSFSLGCLPSYNIEHEGDEGMGAR